MITYRFNGRSTASAPERLDEELDQAQPFRAQLKSGAAPAPLAAAGEPTGPLGFLGTGGPAVSFAPVTRVGSEILVNTATNGAQDSAQITTLSNGGFVIVWRDASAGAGGATGDASSTAIKAQVFAADGTPTGSEILVNTATNGVQTVPQITALSNGGFVVTWADGSAGVGGATGDASSTAVKAQMFAANGAPTGSEILVNTATASGQNAAQITTLSNGGFVVTWVDNSGGVGGATGDVSSTATKAQVFAADGTPTGSEILVNTATTGFQDTPDITALPNGGFVIAWRDTSAGVGGATGDGSGAAVKAQVFAANGARTGSEFLVNTATSATQDVPQITALSGGGFVVIWRDGSQGVGGANGDASVLAVKAQVFAADGARTGSEILVNTATANSQTNAQITALSNGGFVVTWADGSLSADDASSTAVRAQVFAANGAPTGSEILVNTATTSAQSAPQITALSNGGFVVTWADASAGVGGATGDASNAAVKAQVFAANGAPTGSEILVNTATHNTQTTPQITALPNGGFVVAWRDSSFGAGGATGDDSGDAVKAQVFNVGLNAVEQTALSLKGRGFTVTDPDASDVLTVTLSVDYGVLTATAGTSGATVVSGSGTSTVTLMGTASQISALLGGDAASTVTFTADTDTPPASAVFTLAVDDGAGGTATTSAAITITGTSDPTAGNDTVSGAGDIDGLGGDDVIAGDAGDQILDGGADTDTVTYAAAAAGVHVRLHLNTATDGSGGTDTLNNFENIVGSTFNDILIGDGGGNAIDGGTGADVLIGGLGNDTLTGGSGAANSLYGGLGDDTYVVSANDTLVEAVGEGTDTVQTSRAVMHLRSNFENLTYTGGSSFIGRGNAEANVVTGGVAHDTLHGLDGNDTLRGGSGAANTLVGGVGDDTYVVAAVGDTIVEGADEGVDTVQTALGHGRLAANIENLTFTDNGAHTGHGNALANIITGGAGFDTLSGLGGNDTLVGGSGAANVLIGGLGDDTYTVTARDTIIEGAGEGTDTVNTTLNHFVLAANLENLAYAGSGNFAGAGNALTNVITGGNGHDTLTGGGGDDILTGGGGQDLMLVSGLRADYVVLQDGDGAYLITDSVGGRDGVDFTFGVERIRFSNGETVTLASLATPLAAPVEKNLDGPQVLPDDDFLPVKVDGAPLVLPGLDETTETVGVPTASPGHMLTDLGEGLGVDPGVAGDGHPGHDGWLF